MSEPAIAVEQLSLSIGDFHLDKLDFALAAGEILVILGPNGSGKSVTLETIAGFHRPDAGRVLIRGRDVTILPPERRNVAFLVQNFGLFPHLTVEQNVALASRSRHRGREATLPYGNVAKLLAHFGVTPLAQRTPQALSPGEKQRVALARALAAEPDLFLFDEPFSALDRHTSEQLRDELLAFLRDLSIPAIFVAHDHDDAMALADKIIVLRGGTTMQAGAANDVFKKPANLFVARFVGVENILSGHIRRNGDGHATVRIGTHDLEAVALPGLPTEVTACIRGEDVAVSQPGGEDKPASGVTRLKARVTGIRVLGPLATVNLDCGFPLKAHMLAHQARAMQLVPGATVSAEIAADTIHLMPA